MPARSPDAAAAGPSPPPAPRRYLFAAAVTHVAGHTELDVPELADDVRRMEELFLGTADDEGLGYRRLVRADGARSGEGGRAAGAARFAEGARGAEEARPRDGARSVGGHRFAEGARSAGGTRFAGVARSVDGLHPADRHPADRHTLTATLRAFARAPDRRPDDYLVCYLAAHGVVGPDGTHYLLAADSDPDDPRHTGIDTAGLVALLWEETRLERVLVILDACHAEAGADAALKGAFRLREPRDTAQRPGSGLAVIASSRRKEYTAPGALTTAFCGAVRSPATAGHVPSTVRLPLVMGAVAADAGLPGWQRIVWGMVELSAGIPDFLPNPKHLEGVEGHLLEEIAEVAELDRRIALGARERGARAQEFHGHFLPRAKGTDVSTEDVWNFTGRHEALRAVTAWLHAPQPGPEGPAPGGARPDGSTPGRGSAPGRDTSAGGTSGEGLSGGGASRAGTSGGGASRAGTSGGGVSRAGASGEGASRAGTSGGGASHAGTSGEGAPNRVAPLGGAPAAHVPGRGAPGGNAGAPDWTPGRLCVVTGDPGSGKSSLLGLLATLAVADHRAARPRLALPADGTPRPGVLHEAVHAGHKTPGQLLDALAAAARCGARTVGELVVALQARRTPLVVLIDSLDEALEPLHVVDDLLRPLLDPELDLPLRLLVGTRRRAAERLPPPDLLVDLDDEAYADPDAVRAYVRTLLTAPGSELAGHTPRLTGAVAAAVAEAAGRSFLVARITARTLARDKTVPDPADPAWRAALPRLPGEAMERDLAQRHGDQAARARDLLRPLAYAQGAGLPWSGVWPRLAAAVAGKPYTDADLNWLWDAAGSYVVESAEEGESVYRIYHRALIEYLREGHDTRAVQRAITAELRAVTAASGGWPGCLPYVRRYLARHAGEAGVLDELVVDAGYVLAAEPGPLIAALPALRTRVGRRAGEAVRDMELELAEQPRSPDATLRAELRLAALCRGAHELAASCDEAPDGEPPPWRARWAVWNPHDGNRAYAGMRTFGVVVGEDHDPQFVCVGRTTEASGREESRAEFWGLDAGMYHAVPGLPPYIWQRTWTRVGGDGDAHAQAAAVLAQDAIRPDHPLGITACKLLALTDAGQDHTTVWRIPLLPGERDQRGTLLPVEGLAVSVPVAGRPRAALWHRREPTTVRRYLLGQTRALTPPTRAQRRDVYSADLADHAARRDQLAALEAGETRLPSPVTRCVAPVGLPGFLVGCEDGSLHWLDGTEGTGPWRPATAAVTAVTVVRPHRLGTLLLSGHRDGRVHVVPLRGGPPHEVCRTGPVSSLAATRVEGQWLVAIGTEDGFLHRVDLDSGRPVGRPLRVGPGGRLDVAVFRLGSTVCVSVQRVGHGLQVYGLLTGERVAGHAPPHATTALARVDGTLCLGGSDGGIRLWPTPEPTDMRGFVAHGAPVLALGGAGGPGGGLLSVGGDHVLRCWNPDDGAERWQHPLPPPRPWETHLPATATIVRTAAGHPLVVAALHSSTVRMLELRDGIPLRATEFDAGSPVLAVCAGRVRGRDAVVAATLDGRLRCWDVTHGRWYATGPPGLDTGWITALALAPDGSGLLAAGTDDGRVRQWSLPTFRPAAGPLRAHTRGVAALCFVPEAPEAPEVLDVPGPSSGVGGPLRLVTAGDDHAVRAWRPGGTGGPERHPGPGGVPGLCAERRCTDAVGALLPEGTGVWCGDDGGTVRHWTPGGTTGPAVGLTPDWVRVASGPGRAGPVVALADAGVLEVRDLADGRLLRRPEPVEPYVAALAVADVPRPTLYVRGEQGVVESWDLCQERPGPAPTDPGRRTLLPQMGDAATRLRAVPGTAGVPDRMLCTVAGGITFAVHDLDRGELLAVRAWQPYRGFENRKYGWQETGGRGWNPLWVEAAWPVPGDLALVRPEGDRRLHVVDVATGRWATDTVLGAGAADVLPIRLGGEPGVLVVHGLVADFYTDSSLREALARPDPPREGRRAPCPQRRAWWLRPLPARWRRRVPEGSRLSGLRVVRHTRRYWAGVSARHAVVLRGGAQYAVATTRSVRVIDTDSGAAVVWLHLPAMITSLAAGPDGALVVGTSNGAVVFDPFEPQD